DRLLARSGVPVRRRHGDSIGWVYLRAATTERPVAKDDRKRLRRAIAEAYEASSGGCAAGGGAEKRDLVRGGREGNRLLVVFPVVGLAWRGRGPLEGDAAQRDLLARRESGGGERLAGVAAPTVIEVTNGRIGVAANTLVVERRQRAHRGRRHSRRVRSHRTGPVAWRCQRLPRPTDHHDHY